MSNIKVISITICICWLALISFLFYAVSKFESVSVTKEVRICGGAETQ